MSRRWRSAALLLAAASIGVAALAPPLDRRADASFAWHMLQHLLILYAVAPLLLLAKPFDWYARIAGKRATAALVRSTRPLHAIGSPPVALVLFLFGLWATHFSPLYELALERQWVHVCEHLIYLIVGVVFWLPVVGAPPLRPASYPARLFYLIVALPQGALLGMVIGSARAPLYSHYVAVAGSFSAALVDQRNAAAVMWIGGGLALFTALLVTFAVWAQRETGSRASSTTEKPCASTSMAKPLSSLRASVVPPSTHSPNRLVK